MKEEINKIRNALDEHLSAINDNTLEIQGVYDFLNQLENKIDKLNMRLDQLQLNSNIPLPKTSITPLNQVEKKVFLILYTEEMPLNYNEIALRTNLSKAIIPDCLAGLSTKGIPLVRTFCNNQLFIKIEPQFKELQAKENLVNLSLQSFLE